MIKACRSPRTPRTSPDERQRSRPYRTLRYYPPRIQETALGHDSVVQERTLGHRSGGPVVTCAEPSLWATAALRGAF